MFYQKKKFFILGKYKIHNTLKYIAPVTHFKHHFQDH